MTYRLPPLNGLRAFEAAARHMSFKYAADELCVTAGAVSQHVKALEAALGIKLFRRSARAIALTTEGRDYLPSIRTAFEVIAKATEATAPGLRKRKLRLGIAPALDKADCPVLSRLVSHKASTEIVGTRVKDDPALLAEGGLDALLRTSDDLRRPAYRPHRPGGRRSGTDAGDPGHPPGDRRLSPAPHPREAAAGLSNPCVRAARAT